MTDSPTTDTISPERVREELAAILDHPSFQRSPATARLLSFLIEEDLAGRGEDLKETVIGYVFYQRPASYDTKLDSVVRVNASRLRQRLDEYYKAQPDRAIRILFQKGTYTPRYIVSPVNPEAALDLAKRLTSPNDVPAPVLSSNSHQNFGSVATRLAIVCLILLSAAAIFFKHTSSSIHSNAVWSVRPLNRLSGSQSFAQFSPDGKKLVFSWLTPQTERNNIYIEDLTSGDLKRVTSASADDNRPSWSPDGKRLAFIRNPVDGTTKELQIVDLATGLENKIASLDEPNLWLCFTPRISWSNDSRFLITSATYPNTHTCGIIEIDLQTGKITRLTTPPSGVLGDIEAGISPSGDSIAFIRTFGYRRSDLYVVPIQGGVEQRITTDQKDLLGFTWDSDRQHLIFASRRGDGLLRMWKTNLLGDMHPLTDGSSNVAFPSVSPDGKKVVFTDYRNITNQRRWEAGKLTDVLADSSDNSDAQLSPDGSHILYSSDRSGTVDLWTSDRDGQNQHRLVSSEILSGLYARWSPDGSKVVFECRNQSRGDICTITRDGKQLTHVAKETHNCILPSWSADGRSIYYTSNGSGSYQIYRQALDGSSPVQITRHGGMRALESPDGKLIFIHRGLPQGGLIQLSAHVNPRQMEAEENNLLIDQLGPSAWSEWEVGRGTIFYIQHPSGTESSSIVRFDTSNHHTSRVFTLDFSPTGSGSDFSVSLDGRTFLVKKDEYTAQLDLMEEPRK